MKYRVGRKQGRIILDENGRQVASCEIGQEAVAQRLCDLLNEHGLEKNLNLHSVSESSSLEYEEELPSECPNCGSDTVGYDGTGKTPIYECFQCDHTWDI